MVMDEVARVAAIEDRVERLRAASEGVAAAQRMMAEMSRIRRTVIQDLHCEGWTFAKIGAAAGLTRARVHQVRHQGPAPEGAFFGQERLVVLSPPEESDSARQLARLLKKMDCAHELKNLPIIDQISFDAPGLLFLGGPGRWERPGNPVSSDPCLRIRRQAGERVVEDLVTGRLHRTEAADGIVRDVAYVARVPRPDRSGTLLVVTGLRAEGTAGAVQYLAKDIAALHETAPKLAFSMLIEVKRDAAGEITAAPLTAVYPHAGAHESPVVA